MKIAVVGSGGREHALAWKLARSPAAPEVVVLPGNGGTSRRIAVDPTDVEGICRYAEDQGVDLVVVGPESSLDEGLVDALEARNIRAFGPTRAAARLETSKVWSKSFMRRHGVATAPGAEFEGVEEARAQLEELRWDGVLKFDGLAAGKGVFVCRDQAGAAEALETLATRWGADARGVVEKRLFGAELSIIGITDGRTIHLLQPSQDHKQLLDGDKGPNTGGMGAFCPVPFVGEKMLASIRKRVVEPTLAGLRREGIPYRGFLYFGLMVDDKGPHVLEYNVRLGDPEAEVVLPALKSDLVELIDACLDGRLADEPPVFEPGYFVDVVLASAGYPGKYPKGKVITGLDRLDAETLVFHAGTELAAEGLVTAGGRVLNVVARGESLEDAITNVYDECAKVEFEGVTFRRDIGRREGSRW